MKIMFTMIASLMLISSLAFARAPYKTELGLKDCKDCHIAGKMKEPNPSNKLWTVAKDHAAKLKAQEGDFKGKTNCKDCHGGKQIPAK